MEILKKDPVSAQQFLTDYSLNSGALVMQRWRKLGEKLISDFTR
ncbi:MAG: hypothetical protein QNK33_01270 [Bacteroidales bacterium]|nr:hypothetical protein [Bacteroidales bacterium]